MDLETMLEMSGNAADQGRFDDAIRHAEAAVTANPGAANAAIQLATLLRQRSRAGEAAQVLRAALAHESGRAELWNHLGLAERNANRPDASLEAFRRGARLEPGNAWAFTNMAFGLLREPGGRAVETFAPLGLASDPAEIGLGLFCDRFPHTYGFLTQQFNTYLASFADCRVYSYGRRVMEPWAPGQFEEAAQAWAALHGGDRSRLHELVPGLSPAGSLGDAGHALVSLQDGRFRKPRLAHCIFAMNADLFRPLWETLAIPFTFTLNPGGGFRLNDPYSDERLRRVFASPMFRRVIVTYQRTRDYIVERFNVPEECIVLIPGTIVMERFLAAHARPKRRYPADKDTLDVCFVGIRYSPTGADKGYDRFIAAAAVLVERFPHLRLHVIGNFDAGTVDVSALDGRITFHGRRDQAWMAGFYSGMDAVVSPNVADQLALGAFDGFPVTSCIEAGMCGVALFATDPMGLNRMIESDRHYVAITDRPGEIAETLIRWLADPPRLYALAGAGQKRFAEVWGEAAQMAPRVELMRRWLAEVAPAGQ